MSGDQSLTISVYSIVSTTGVSSAHLDGSAYKLRQASDIEASY
jgi:hypothetical protein